MGTRTLRVDDIAIETIDMRSYRSKGLLKRFRDFIERSDWDERLEDRLKWVNGVCLIGAAAGMIFVVLAGIRILF